MKTLIDISTQHNIPVTTLATRIRSCGIITIREGRSIFINHEQEKQITFPVKRQYHGLVNRHINPFLVWEYKLNAPFLSNEELAECLAVKPMEIEMILKDDFILLESKMNH